MIRSLATNYNAENIVPADKLGYIDFPELPLHETMWSLSIADDGVIYIGVCGELTGGLSVHLYAYDPQKHQLKEIADYSEVCGQRSEERRVGKGCRSRWSPEH